MSAERWANSRTKMLTNNRKTIFDEKLKNSLFLFTGFLNIRKISFFSKCIKKSP